MDNGKQLLLLNIIDCNEDTSSISGTNRQVVC